LGPRFGDALLARPKTSRPFSVSFIQWDMPARRIPRSGRRWLVVARADVYGGSGIEGLTVLGQCRSTAWHT
jgi:hypothetical protein